MRHDTNPRSDHSPLEILTELAVEGTSSLVEAQRTLLNLAQQENDIVMNGVKERVSGFTPAAAMTDLVRRSLDTMIGMQQDLLTTTSKHSLPWFEAVRSGKGARGAHLVDLAREEMETFVRAQKKFLEVIAEETSQATSAKAGQHAKAAKKAELSKLAQDATHALIEAQKRLLDVASQQLNVNLSAAARGLELLSPSRLAPVASLTSEKVKDFVKAEESLIESVIKPPKRAKGVRETRHKPA